MDAFIENLLTREITHWTTKTYNVEGDNSFSPSLQSLTTGSAFENLGFFQSGSVIVFMIPEIILSSSTKYLSFLTSYSFGI